MSVSLGSYRPVFNKELEIKLAEYLRRADNLFYGLTRKQLRELAYLFAENNKVQHPFNHQLKMAGKKWFLSFCKRHNFSLRSPEKISAARVSGFNKAAVDEFFSN